LKIPPNIDWDLLKKFNMCSRHKSLASAAKEAGLHPPAFGNQLKRLEVSMNTQLFERRDGIIKNIFTPEGKKLSERIEKIENFLYQTYDDYFLEENNELKIYTTNGISYVALPNIIESFCEKYPNIKILVINQTPPKFLDNDEIIIRSDVAKQKDIKTIKLFDLKFKYYASTEYLKKFGNPLSYEESQDHRFLFCHGSRDPEQLTCESNILEQNIISSNVEFLYQMALRGYGIIELPTIYPGIEKLVETLKNVPTISQTIFLGYREKNKKPGLIEKFVNMIQFIDFNVK
jgi:DNA-binding transcriptional LysR family regulator